MVEASPLILIIEDEPQIRRFLQAALTGAGYRPIEAETGKMGLAQAATQPPDAIILDLGLPDMDGLEVARQIRAWSSVPIIVLSARGQEKDKVAALDLGADDYLTKPFGVGELLARIRVALRHAARTEGEDGQAVMVVGDLKVDLAARRVFRADTEVHLTPMEYRLLTTLVKHAGKVLTHAFLLKEVWGPANARETHYLRVFMANLRHKLEADASRPRYLLTEQGVGYRLADE
ncbi:MAG: response regulator [Phycisphaeraceae bacterium]|nr:response regulator [Phycisphaeraceae bacterium]